MKVLLAFFAGSFLGSFLGPFIYPIVMALPWWTVLVSMGVGLVILVYSARTNDAR